DPGVLPADPPARLAPEGGSGAGTVPHVPADAPGPVPVGPGPAEGTAADAVRAADRVDRGPDRRRGAVLRAPRGPDPGSHLHAAVGGGAGGAGPPAAATVLRGGRPGGLVRGVRRDAPRPGSDRARRPAGPRGAIRTDARPGPLCLEAGPGAVRPVPPRRGPRPERPRGRRRRGDPRVHGPA